MEPAGQPLPVPDGARGAAPAPPPGWVLVCDDTASIRLLIRVNLELAGFAVLEATDGGAALRLLQQHVDRPPAAVIVDAQMSPLDGWWAAAQIRRSPRLSHVPVVMVTAALQQHEEQRAAAAGLDAFVGKPFDPGRVVELVRWFAAHGRGGAPGAGEQRPPHL